MNRHERGLEFKVGIFVFFGLAMLGALVVQFGRLGEGFKTYYALTIRFSDASGLLKGSDVLLAGARIGKVSDGPRLVREGNGVAVPLKIYDYVKIPEGSKFMVGSSGLLGDRFVSVTMPPGVPTKFLQPNAYLNGTRETGIDDLTREGGALVGDLRGVVQKIDTTMTRLNEEMLSKQTAENFKSSVAHLNEATGAFAESAKKLRPVVDKADSAMDSTKKAADDLQKVMASATQGKGLLAALLANLWPGLFLGLILGLVVVLIDRLLKGVSLRLFSSATFGLLLGLIFANLLMASQVLRYQSEAMQWSIQLIVYAVFGYLGMMLAMRSSRDEFSLIIPYVRFARETTQHEPLVVDTNVIIDGRIADLCATGFLSSSLIVPRFILDELQLLADSHEPTKRERGRRGLEILNQLQRSREMELTIHESTGEDVDVGTD